MATRGATRCYGIRHQPNPANRKSNRRPRSTNAKIACRPRHARLREDGVAAADTSVITPFKAVQENLKRLLGKTMVSGTIHTMQGKEAAIVILVLGGNTQGAGARNWAVSEPNLLNVAATRAKRRLYVIGDCNDWQNRAMFGDVMDLLPLQRLP